MKKCHFIGIGGIGMSGLARLMLAQKTEISGSDISASAITDSLAHAGVQIYIGHSANHIHPDTTVVYSTDIKKNNPEYQAALKFQCQMLHRSELLQKIMENYQGLAVAGTHGKTTTSSLLTWVLENSGHSPSYAIGGVVPQLTSNAGVGTGKYFVAEACESDGTFVNYHPFGAIVTNIDSDHMDYYKTEEALQTSFKTFAEQVQSPEHLFWCGDDKTLTTLHLRGNSYGFGEQCTLRLSNFHQKEWSVFFDVSFNGEIYKNIEVSLTGRHNALNAAAIFGLALSLGIDENSIRAGLRSFKGVLRRCEKKGDINGVLFLDDYAHHPTELKATLEAIRRAVGERRIVVVYQPHRYSRAKECMGLYQGAFEQADALFLTEIYAAREEPIPGVSHEQIMEEINHDLKGRCQHVSRTEIAEKLSLFIRPHDVVVTLGAGDVTRVSGEVIERITSTPPKKIKVGLIFGGASVEHDISLISSANILNAMCQGYYDVEQFSITRQGEWSHGIDAREKLKGKALTKFSPEVLTRLMECDILFPVLHGTCGEDGTIQGFFEILGKAYVGCDHRSAAVSMDKVLSKRLILEAGLPTAKFVSFNLHEWKTVGEELIRKINKDLTYPLFVKPVHLGSTIGVHKVSKKESLNKAIEAAFRFDDRLVVENGFENMREIEFSILGNDEITVFPPGEIFTEGQVHDYDSKYG
ncbi:MAG: UDP-N-acetylmuramate--L-alanine ligase, partial [Parachlamydiaceae bacterium]